MESETFVEPIYGNVPDDWSLTTIGQLVDRGDANIQTGPFGTMLHAESYIPSGKPVVAVKHLGDNRLLHEELPRIGPEDSERLARYTLREGDIVFGRKGAVERRAYINSSEDGWLQGSDCIRVRFISQNINTKYVSYVLGSSPYRKWIEKNAHGATMPSLNQEIIRRIPLPIPPIPEQRAIARILSSLDDKIELNRRMNETLEAMAFTIFKSWFVNFEPVRSKAESLEPEGIDAETAALFPDSFEETVLGVVPRGWIVSKVGRELVTVLGGTPSRSISEYWSNGTVPWINSGKVNEFRIIEPAEYITEKAVENSATKLLPERTTVLAITGATLGQVSLLEIASCANQSVIGILQSHRIPSEYIYFWIKYKIDDLISWQTGGAQQHINKNNANDLDILCPNDEIFSTYLKLVRPVFNMIKHNCFESLNLETIRKGVLPNLLSGKIPIKNIMSPEIHDRKTT